MLAKRKNNASIASYWGWIKHCNGNHLLKTYYMHQFKDFGIKPKLQCFVGDKIKMNKVLNREIVVHDFV
jgi:hypothetical protein